MIKNASVLLLCMFYSSFVIATAETPKKNQVEDIFIWKISDELQLTAKQEKEFGDIHRTLNKKKFELTEDLKKIQTDIRISQPPLTSSEQSKLVQKNRQLLLKLNQLNIDEFDLMKKLLGSQKFLSYLFLKQEINAKFKSMVLGRTPEKFKEDVKNKSNEPVVTEEK